MPSPSEIERAMAETGGNKTAAAETLGISRHALRRALLKAGEEARLPPTGFEVKEQSVSYDADGQVLRQTVHTKAAPGERYEVPPGYLVKGESALTDSQGNLVLRWVKTKQNAEQLSSLVRDLQEAFAKHEGTAPVLPAPEQVSEELLTIYPVPDLHMGMYAWGPECGDDYDTEIATRNAIQAISKLVGRSAPSRDAVLLIKGDFFHQNDQSNATPLHKHRLDVDGRWDRVYLQGCQLLLTLVDLILQKHERLEFVVIPGNHDEDAARVLRVSMMLHYQNHPRVWVYDRPGYFWYRRFGSTLLGAQHGHTMRDPKDMALTMAADCAEDWGKSRFRQIFTGHIHHERSREITGQVRWESFQTPAPNDAYSRGGGYRSGRSLSSITIHTENGEVGRNREPIGITTAYRPSISELSR